MRRGYKHINILILTINLRQFRDIRWISVTHTLNTSDPGKLDTKQESSTSNTVAPENPVSEKSVFKVPELPRHVLESRAREQERMARLNSSSKSINERCCDAEEEVIALEEQLEYDPDDAEVEEELKKKVRLMELYQKLKNTEGINAQNERPQSVHTVLRDSRKLPEFAEYKDVLDKELKRGQVIPEDTVGAQGPLSDEDIAKHESFLREGRASLNTSECSKSDTKRKSSETNTEKEAKRAKQEDTGEKGGSEAFSICEPSDLKENSFKIQFYIFLSNLAGLDLTPELLGLVDQPFYLVLLTLSVFILAFLFFIPYTLYSKYKQYKNNK